MSIVRNNLMTQPGYAPYCGNERCGGLWPRTGWTGSQFRCGYCKWESTFPADFIEQYTAKWHKEQK